MDAPDFRLETAACLWEAATTLREASMIHREDATLEQVFLTFQAHGMASVRLYVTEMTDACIHAWTVFMDGLEEPLDAYDWHWCPGFVREAVDWTGLEPRLDAGKLAAFGNAERVRNGAAPIADERWMIEGATA